jgi:hypothetical protein
MLSELSALAEFAELVELSELAGSRVLEEGLKGQGVWKPRVVREDAAGRRTRWE